MEVDEAPHLAHVSRLSVRSQPHDFVLGAVDLESQVVGECAVEEPERMREVDFFEQVDLPIPAHSVTRRGPLAHAVHGQDRRLPEGGDEEGARGV